jgi:hypothetical protein
VGAAAILSSWATRLLKPPTFIEPNQNDAEAGNLLHRD